MGTANNPPPRRLCSAIRTNRPPPCTPPTTCPLWAATLPLWCWILLVLHFSRGRTHCPNKHILATITEPSPRLIVLVLLCRLHVALLLFVFIYDPPPPVLSLWLYLLEICTAYLSSCCSSCGLLQNITC